MKRLIFIVLLVVGVCFLELGCKGNDPCGGPLPSLPRLSNLQSEIKTLNPNDSNQWDNIRIELSGDIDYVFKGSALGFSAYACEPLDGLQIRELTIMANKEYNQIFGRDVKSLFLNNCNYDEGAFLDTLEYTQRASLRFCQPPQITDTFTFTFRFVDDRGHVTKTRTEPIIISP